MEFADALEINVRSYELIDPSQADPADFLPLTPYDLEELQREVAGIAVSVKNRFLRRLIGCFIQDDKLFRRFCTAPAARMVHQAYLGGLLEHSVKTAIPSSTKSRTFLKT